MAYAVQFRRGTTAQHASFTGAAGEVTVNTDTNELVVHDGTTVGGHVIGTSNGGGGGASTLTDLNITDGTSGQVLTTDGAGTFTFTTLSTGSANVEVGTTEPSSPSTGDLWFASGRSTLNVYTGSRWEQLVTTVVAGSTSVASFGSGPGSTWDDGYVLRDAGNITATYNASTYKYSLDTSPAGDTFAGIVPNANFLSAVSAEGGVWFKVKFEDMDGDLSNRKLGGWHFTSTTSYSGLDHASNLSSTELRGDGNSVNNSAADELDNYGWSTKYNPGAQTNWWSALYFNPTSGYSAHYISSDDVNWTLWADKEFSNPISIQGIWASVWRRTEGQTASVTLVDVDDTVLGLI